jgi:hypothetical protein
MRRDKNNAYFSVRYRLLVVCAGTPEKSEKYRPHSKGSAYAG